MKEDPNQSYMLLQGLSPAEAADLIAELEGKGVTGIRINESRRYRRALRAELEKRGIQW